MSRPAPPGRWARAIQVALPAVFLLGGAWLLARGEALGGAGALLLVPGAVDGALPPGRRADPRSRRATAIALLTLVGALAFVVGLFRG